MYEAKLEARLKEIFGVNEILFDNFKYGKNQQVLFCNVLDTFFNYEEGMIHSRITGTIEISCLKNKLQNGYLTLKANKNANKDFYFSPLEKTINYEYNGFAYNKYLKEFVYFFSEEYNPAIANLNDLKIELEVN